MKMLTLTFCVTSVPRFVFASLLAIYMAFELGYQFNFVVEYFKP